MNQYLNVRMSVKEMSKLLIFFNCTHDLNDINQSNQCFIQSISDPTPTPMHGYILIDLGMTDNYHNYNKYYLYIKREINF